MAEIQDTSSADVRASIQHARDTFNSGRTKSVEWRRAQLKAIVRMLDENAESIAAALKNDLSVNKFMTHAIEIESARGEVSFMIANLDKWTKSISVASHVAALPASTYIVPEPYGLVLVMPAWNYPVSLMVNPMATAIAAGNAVVVKPSELSPHVALEMERLCIKYLDNDAVRFIQGGAATATSILEQRFDLIQYTGNSTVARIVHKAANKYLTPVLLELGGKSPAIVTDKANLSTSIKRIVWGKYSMNMGQTCITPDYIITTPTQVDNVVSSLKKTIEKFYTTNPKTCPDVSRIVNHRHTNRIIGLLDDAQIKVVHGGEYDVDAKYIAPTVVIAQPNAKCMQSEIFGPILPILVLKDLDAAINYVNEHDKPLALYVFSSDAAEQQKVESSTSAGGMCINDCILHVASPDCPFGGVGESGMGAYHGYEGFKTFSHMKPVLKKFLTDPALRFPPFTDDKVAKLVWLGRLDLKLIKNVAFLALLVGLVAVLLNYVGPQTILKQLKF